MGKKDALDKKVMALIETVKERRAKVGSLKKPHFETCMSLDLPGYERVNILVCKDLGLLATACGVLLRMKQDIEAASKELDVEIDPRWQNYLIDDWIADVKLRVKVTQLKREQERLAKLEAKLNELTSPEQRREMALAEIEEDLK